MIVPLTLERAEYVAAHLRDRDRREVQALLPAGQTLREWSHGLLLEAGDRWAVLVGETPVAMCGVRAVPNLPHLAVTWAVGTDRKLEAGIALQRHAFEVHRVWRELGVRKFQCYCLDTPEESSEWLERLGYRLEGRIAGLGVNGENFLLWGTHGH